MFEKKYPHVDGIEILEMYNKKDKKFCFANLEIIKDKRNCLYGNCNFYDKCLIMTEFIK